MLIRVQEGAACQYAQQREELSSCLLLTWTGNGQLMSIRHVGAATRGTRINRDAFYSHYYRRCFKRSVSCDTLGLEVLSKLFYSTWLLKAHPNLYANCYFSCTFLCRKCFDILRDTDGLR
jgi:hypothetical protein